MTIEVLDEAKDDLIDDFPFYEEQSPGLGFSDESNADDRPAMCVKGPVPSEFIAR